MYKSGKIITIKQYTPNLSGGSFLLELVLLVVLAAVLFQVSPGAQGWNYRSTSVSPSGLNVHVTKLVELLDYAKQRSIRLGKEVVVCGFHTDAPNQCSHDNRVSGWLVYSKSVSNNYVLQKVLQRLPSSHDIEIETAMTLDVMSQQQPDQQQSSRLPIIKFQPNGRADRRGTLAFCDPVQQGQQGVVVSVSGAGEMEVFDAAACNYLSASS